LAKRGSAEEEFDLRDLLGRLSLKRTEVFEGNFRLQISRFGGKLSHEQVRPLVLGMDLETAVQE
jgi:hypothetical protein